VFLFWILGRLSILSDEEKSFRWQFTETGMIILSSAPSSWYLFQHFRSVIRLSGKAVGTIDAVLAVEYPAGEGEGSENGVEGVGDDGVDHSEDEKGRPRERRVVLVLVQVVISALEGTA